MCICRLVALLAALTCVSACGGSSSETPWPMEPEGPTLGPAGENPTSVAPTNMPTEETPSATEQVESEPEAPGKPEASEPESGR